MMVYVKGPNNKIILDWLIIEIINTLRSLGLSYHCIYYSLAHLDKIILKIDFMS